MDSRPDEVVKLELYQRFIEHQYNVFAVFDDRYSVTKLWTNLGLFVFNVGQAPYFNRF